MAHDLCGPVAIRGYQYFFRVIVALNPRGYFWLSVAIFLGRGVFFSRGHFYSFFVTICLKCRKYRQKIAAWLFCVGVRGYFPWLSVAIHCEFLAIFRNRGYSNIPWLFFSRLFF